MTQHVTHERHIAMLTTAFSPEVMALFDDDDIIEVMLNPDGQLFIESITQGKHVSDIQMPPSQSENIIKLVAALKNQTIDDEAPMVSSELPFHGARFQGWLPPVVASPCFAIRKRAKRIFTLQDYQAQKSLSSAQAKLLSQMVQDKQNIVIAGGTGSGKTTFANALLHELAGTDDRMIVIEDLPELQLDAQDVVTMVTTPSVSMRDLVKGSLRMRPDRIIIGEVRDGAALELLKSWNTGHPGGVCTIHANTAQSTPSRFEDLIQEVVLTASKRLIAEAIDVIIYIERTKAGQHHIKSIQRVNYVDESYQLVPV